MLLSCERKKKRKEICQSLIPVRVLPCYNTPGISICPCEVCSPDNGPKVVSHTNAGTGEQINPNNSCSERRGRLFSVAWSSLPGINQHAVCTEWNPQTNASGQQLRDALINCCLFHFGQYSIWNAVRRELHFIHFTDSNWLTQLEECQQSRFLR